MEKKITKISCTFVVLAIITALIVAFPALASDPPLFEATPRTSYGCIPGCAPLEVTFTVLVGGSSPTAAFGKYEWDFDGDGVFDITTEVPYGDEAPESWIWTYSACGIYTVCLKLTDWNGITYYGERVDYIRFVFDEPWSYDTNYDGVIQKSEAIQAVQDYFSGKITKEQTIEVVLLYWDK